MAFAESNGASIHFEVVGEGDDVLMIPGLALSGAAWAGIVPRVVERGYRVITYDPRGAGMSDKPHSPYTAELVADDAATVLAAAGSNAAHVVGLSMGGMIAQEFAVRHPERVQSLVLTSTYARVDDWSRRIFELRMEIVERLGVEVGFRMSFLFVFSPYAFRESKAMIEGIEASVAATDKPGLLRQMQFCLDHDAFERLNGITHPTLVACGEFDLLTSAIQNKELADAIPGAELHIFPRACHGLVWEQPGAYGDLLLEFLDAVRNREKQPAEVNHA